MEVRLVGVFELGMGVCLCKGGGLQSMVIELWCDGGRNPCRLFFYSYVR